MRPFAARLSSSLANAFRPRLLAAATALAAILLTGCPKPNEEPWASPARKDYGRALPPGQLALRKIPPEMYPDFSRAFAGRAGLEESIANSIAFFQRPSSKRYYPYGDISHERALASLHAFKDVLREARDGKQLDQLIRDRFDVYQSVGCDDVGTVYYTGYYTPIFEGRKQRDATFRYPLYKSPPDLARDADGMTQGRKTPDGRVVPYSTRREIEEQRLLEGHEIAWLKDPFEAYVVSIQGSGKLKLADGSLWEIGYAGNNGHDYTPVAEAMIRDGVIKKEELSLQTLISYFKQHPENLQKYCWQNPRYVFFQETKGGPYGSINVPVTPYRSIAVDKKVFPRGCLAMIDTTIPVNSGGAIRQTPTAEFVCDQDTGGAIRAAGRCDLYMGVGGGAEALAGRTGAEGKLYYIFVKPGATPAPRQ